MEIVTDVGVMLGYLAVGLVLGAALEHATQWWSRGVLPRLRRRLVPD